MSDTDVLEELHSRLKDTLDKTLYVAFSRVTDSKSWEPPPPVILKHVEYMARIERNGALFAAGPFVDESGARLTDGLVIVRAQDAKSATRLLEDDPFHADGYRTFELMRWQLNQGRVGLQLTFSNQRALFE